MSQEKLAVGLEERIYHVLRLKRDIPVLGTLAKQSFQMTLDPLHIAQLYIAMLPQH
jgi:hypothetical protein